MTTANRPGVDLLSVPRGDAVEIAVSVSISPPRHLRGLPTLNGFDVGEPRRPAWASDNGPPAHQPVAEHRQNPALVGHAALAHAAGDTKRQPRKD